MRLAASYTEHSSDRDDLFQDIAIALWKALPGFRGECSERTFLFRVAHNRAIDYLRRHRAITASIDDDSPLRDHARIRKPVSLRNNKANACGKPFIACLCPIAKSSP